MVPTLNKMAGAVKFSTHPLHFYTDDADSVSSSFSSIVLEPIRKNEDEHEDEEECNGNVRCPRFSVSGSFDTNYANSHEFLKFQTH